MGKKLYVGNLSWETAEDKLREAFVGQGRTVEEVAVITDRETGRPRGFAFVTMGSATDAEEAIRELDGSLLDGRNIRVNEAQERTGGGGRGGSGGGGGGGGGGGRRDRW